MKKFFALMLVIAMLSVAGSAMAAARVTADPATVTVQAGGSTATSALVGVDDAHPNASWTFYKVSGPTWATVAGSTAFFAPDSTIAAQSATMEVRGIGSYTTADDAGHTTVGSADANVTITINVTAASVAPQESTSEKATTTKQATVIKIKVKVVRVSSAVFATKQQMVTTNAQRSLLNVIADIVVRALEALGNNTTIRTLLPDTNLQEAQAPTDSYIADDNEGNLQKASAEANREYTDASGNKRVVKTVGVLPPVRAAQSGPQPFSLPKLPPETYGKKPGINMRPQGLLVLAPMVGSAATFSAAASDTAGNEAVFMDSLGNIVEIIPGGGFGDPSADEGVLTAIVYVDEGETYVPAVTADMPESEVSQFESQTGTTEVEVTTVATNADINETSTFSPAISPDVLVAIISADGRNINTLPTTIASTTDVWTVSTLETEYMYLNNLAYVAKLPPLTNATLTAGTYIAKVTFDTTVASIDSAPYFYNNGVEDGGMLLSADFYAVSGTTVTKILRDNAATYVANGREAYLVFTTDGTHSLAKPSVVVEFQESTTPTPTPGGDDPTPTPGGDDPTPTQNVLGSSGGGCSAGSAVLALALLGSFILTRKK